jgi:hypothetical protein
MKRIRLFMILSPILLILVIVVWLVLHLLTLCIEGRAQTHAEMRDQAEIAIKKTGGADVLEKEAKTVLDNFRARPNERWVDVKNGGSNCPAILKLYTLLSPYGHAPWVVEDKKGLPAHVVIRFGSHTHYAYIWIFDPADMPLEKTEGVEHLSGTVYLAEKNE